MSREILEEVAWTGTDRSEQRNSTINRFIEEVDRKFLNQNIDSLPTFWQSFQTMRDFRQ